METLLLAGAMENLLQVVVIMFMLFLCALCLFAVVVIARDIVHETLKKREGNKEHEDDKKTEEQPAATVIMQEPVVETKKEEEPVVVPEVVQEVVASEAEEDPDAVKFSRGASLTMVERYSTLSTEFKRYFDEIVRHVLAKEGIKENKQSNYYDYKIGAHRVLRLSIKRGETVCEFNFVDKDFMDYAGSSSVKMKRSATQIKVTEAAAVGAVKDGIDLVCKQIEAFKEHKKELARAKRRESRKKGTNE